MIFLLYFSPKNIMFYLFFIFQSIGILAKYLQQQINQIENYCNELNIKCQIINLLIISWSTNKLYFVIKNNSYITSIAIYVIIAH